MTGERNVLIRDLGQWIALGVMGVALAGCGLVGLVPLLPPDQPPTGVTASLGQYDDGIQISWGQVDRATSYRVFRSVAEAGEFLEVGTAAGVTFRDTTVEPSKLYWYKVRACNATGCGPESVAVPGYAGFPPAPANVRASDGDYPNKIVIRWDPVPGATHYQVFRDLAREGDYRILPGAENVPTNSFEDTTAAVGLRYWYRVRACDATRQRCGWPSEDRDSGCRAPCPPGRSLDAEG